MKYLVVIPARKGSKGVPNKNKKLLGGKPLIQYTIEAALNVFKAEEICISTDDTDIFELAKELGIEPPFLRPEYLSTDSASSQDVLLHALNYYKEKEIYPEAVVLLQATSPFRNSSHISMAVQLFNLNLDMVVSVFETKSNPYFNLFEENENGFLTKSKKSNFTRRQDCPNIFEYNGAIYIINSESLMQKKIGQFDKVIKYEMGTIESHDIDNQFDWDLAEIILQKYYK